FGVRLHPTHAKASPVATARMPMKVRYSVTRGPGEETRERVAGKGGPAATAWPARDDNRARGDQFLLRISNCNSFVPDSITRVCLLAEPHSGGMYSTIDKSRSPEGPPGSCDFFSW